ncbi:ATP-dependent Clp protease ATP-binding subunit [Patescibacteria group bacterium]|nr:MAG: ATP-dependent Clp protease ATP-binding subunit [Patescibacteria group bacterium]
MDHNIIEKFTTHLKSVLVRAYTLAHELGQSEITLDHLLWSLSTERGCLGAELLQKAEINHEELRRAIAEEAKKHGREPASEGGAESNVPVLSDTTKRAIEKAVLTANLYEHKYIGTEHLLSGILQLEDERLLQIFLAEKIDLRRLKTQVTTALKSTSKFPDLAGELEELAPGDVLGLPREEVAAALPADEAKRGKRPSSKTPALDFFTVDLTGEEAQKRIDPVIGREKEIERLIQILARRTKNNPVLLGEAGVGKTAIAEGLARRIAENSVPDVLKGRHLLALDLPLIVAGTVYRGEFEGRLKQIIDEVKSRPDAILFIDEVHNITGMGSASGSMDAANILKPALSRGEIRCIGATTQGEYKKFIESDPALERRFQPILIGEPSAEETIKILFGLREKYQSFHAVTISDEAVESAVKLAARHLQDKMFPDKAIDLVDEAAAAARVAAGEKPETNRLKELEAEIKNLRAKKSQAVRNERYAQALELKEKELSLTQEIAHCRKSAAVPRTPVAAIGRKEIAEVVSRMVGIPAASILAEEGRELTDLEERLRARVIGQDQVTSGVTEYLRRARAGLTSANRPLASFLFLGPSGVGKTSLAAAIAEEVMGGAKSLIRLDMSEFGESFTVSKLLGAPAGYVGYRETTKLTDAVKRRPYSVVLFDEVEKAHADVLNILLQILENGELNDATGRTVHFKNAVVILTSNIGAERWRKGSLGFAANGLAPEELSADMRREAGENFRPELLNRLDKIFVFRPLQKTDIEKIIQRELTELNRRLAEREFKVQLTKKVLALLADSCDVAETGARSVRRILQEKIESVLAARLLAGEIKKGEALKVDARNGKLTYS